MKINRILALTFVTLASYSSQALAATKHEPAHKKASLTQSEQKQAIALSQKLSKLKKTKKHTTQHPKVVPKTIRKKKSSVANREKAAPNSFNAIVGSDNNLGLPSFSTASSSNNTSTTQSSDSSDRKLTEINANNATPLTVIKDTVGAEPSIIPLVNQANKPYTVKGVRYVPVKSNTKKFTQVGLASWYGPRFHGKKTATGERYNQNAMTAAHKRLPIPSYIRVTRISTGKSIIVKVNDRGPFHSNRIIDLSYGAAKKLKMVGKGSAKVRIETITPNEIKRLKSKTL